MAERRISNLVPVEQPSVNDVLPVVNAGVTKKVSINNLVKVSDFSTFTINNLPDPVPIVSQSLAPTDQLVAHNGTIPQRVRLQNIYPIPIPSSTISLTFSNTNRNLQASLLTNSISSVHIRDGAVTEAKIDPNAKIRGATGGGTDRIFYENDQNITTDYTITNGKNAMTAGPITIDDGVTVTIPDGSTWTVV